MVVFINFVVIFVFYMFARKYIANEISWGSILILISHILISILITFLLLWKEKSSSCIVLFNVIMILLTSLIITCVNFQNKKIIKNVGIVIYVLTLSLFVSKMWYYTYTQISNTPSDISIEMNDFYPYGGKGNTDRLPSYEKDKIPVDFKMGNSYLRIDSGPEFSYLSGAIGKNLFKKDLFNDAPIVVEDEDDNLQKKDENTGLQNAQTDSTQDKIFTMNFEHPNSILKASGTMNALKSLIERKTSVIITGKLTEAQEQYVKENKARLEYNPICKDAIVFFVNKENPRESISLEDLGKIVNGTCYAWDDLGIKNFGKIKLLQTSGDDSAYAVLESEFKNIKSAKDEEIVNSTIEMINQVSNKRNAIGYGLKSQVDLISQEAGSNIKILKINEVCATEKTIIKNEYPLIAQIYFVNTDWLITDSLQEEKYKNSFAKWVYTKNGQDFIRMIGFVPLGTK